MDSKFLIQIRKIINSFNTSEVSDSDIYKLGKNYYKLNEQVTNAILRNQETGKIFLTSNLKQLKSEYEYIDLKIRLKLKEMESKGFNDYNQNYSNIKSVLLSLDDAISILLKTYQTYYIQKEKPETKTEKKKINAKEFTRLELDLKLLDENLYIDYPTRAKKIQDLMNTKDHEVFNFIEIKGEVKTDTIDDYIRNYFSQSDEIQYFNENSEKKYKELCTKVKGYLGK